MIHETVILPNPVSSTIAELVEKTSRVITSKFIEEVRFIGDNETKEGLRLTEGWPSEGYHLLCVLALSFIVSPGEQEDAIVVVDRSGAIPPYNKRR